MTEVIYGIEGVTAEVAARSMTSRQKQGLLFAAGPKFARGLRHTAREFWDNGHGVGRSVLHALARREMVHIEAVCPTQYRVTSLGYGVAQFLSEKAGDDA